MTGGCFGSHGMGGPGPSPEPDAGPPPGDPPADPPDDPPIARPVPVPECGDAPAREVRVEVGSETGGRCGFGSFEGAMLYDLSTRPDVDGLSLLVDFCPGADADCVCDVVVSGIGTDAADDIAAATDLGLLSVELAPSGIVLEAPCADGSCTDGMCACVPTLVLAAADGSTDEPPVSTEALTVVSGEEVCRVSDSGECDFVAWSLTMVTWSSGFPGAIGTETTLEQGQTIRGEDLAGLSLRNLRSSGLDCGGEIPRAAAWAAWGAFEGI